MYTYSTDMSYWNIQVQSLRRQGFLNFLFLHYAATNSKININCKTLECTIIIFGGGGMREIERKEKKNALNINILSGGELSAKITSNSSWCNFYVWSCLIKCQKKYFLQNYIDPNFFWAVIALCPRNGQFLLNWSSKGTFTLKCSEICVLSSHQLNFL